MKKIFDGLKRMWVDFPATEKLLVIYLLILFVLLKFAIN